MPNYLGRLRVEEAEASKPRDKRLSKIKKRNGILEHYLVFFCCCNMWAQISQFKTSSI